MHLTACHPKIMVSADGTGVVSQAGGLLLTQALRVTGLDRGLDAALEQWRPARAVHGPGKIITTWRWPWRWAPCPAYGRPGSLAAQRAGPRCASRGGGDEASLASAFRLKVALA